MGRPHKHAEVIKAWADGKDVEVRSSFGGTWARYPGGEGVILWSPDCEYRVFDPYRHLREALREGKTLEHQSLGNWVPLRALDEKDPDRTFVLEPEWYRVKPEPLETKVRLELPSVSNFVPTELNLSVKHVDGRIVDINLESWEP
jgi:hypothetical protein